MEGGSEVELDPTGGALEKTNDPVRIYLRGMGAVPLLTREGEVDIAKRIERGRMRIEGALPPAYCDPIAISDRLRLYFADSASIKTTKTTQTKPAISGNIVWNGCGNSYRWTF